MTSCQNCQTIILCMTKWGILVDFSTRIPLLNISTNEHGILNPTNIILTRFFNILYLFVIIYKYVQNISIFLNVMVIIIHTGPLYILKITRYYEKTDVILLQYVYTEREPTHCIQRFNEFEPLLVCFRLAIGFLQKIEAKDISEYICFRALRESMWIILPPLQ